MTNKDEIEVKEEEKSIHKEIKEDIKEEEILVTESDLDKSELEEDTENKKTSFKDRLKDNGIEEIDYHPSFFKRLIASLVDQAILIGISAIALVIFDFLIGFIGYMVEMPSAVLLIIFGIANVLYGPLFERKNKRTFGKRILAIG